MPAEYRVDAKEKTKKKAEDKKRKAEGEMRACGLGGQMVGIYQLASGMPADWHLRAYQTVANSKKLSHHHPASWRRAEMAELATEPSGGLEPRLSAHEGASQPEAGGDAPAPSAVVAPAAQPVPQFLPVSAPTPQGVPSSLDQSPTAAANMPLG